MRQRQREWRDALQKLNEVNVSASVLYPARFSFTSEGTVSSCQDRQPPREFKVLKPLL